MGWWSGSKGKMKKVSNYNAQQEQGSQDYWNNPIQNTPLYGAGSDYLQRILSNDPELMAQFEAPYMQNFEQNIAPGIAERFGGMGTGGGAMSSSGLNNSLAQAGRGLQSDLAAMRAQLGMTATQTALGYAQQPYNNINSGLQQRPFENYYVPPTNGVSQPFLQGAGNAFGNWSTGGMGGFGGGNGNWGF
jgi:hypothetical protein